MKQAPVAITMGDINGIGPEVIIKSLQNVVDMRQRFIITGPFGAFNYWQDQLGIFLKDVAPVTEEEISLCDAPLMFFEPPDLEKVDIQVGRETAESGHAAAKSIISAVDLALKGKVDAIVTAPVSKYAIGLAGYDFRGHTEFLAKLANVPSTVMMLVSEKIKIALATTHIPLHAVDGALSQESLIETIEVLALELKTRLNISLPRIALAGLNPHAGEHGEFGDAEEKVIKPAIDILRSRHISLEGPFSADALFSRMFEDAKYDAYLAMYHDQGMIPIKIISEGQAVNYTCGLPFIRTSPGHGTAFDLAGTGRACPASMTKAIEYAVYVSKTSGKCRIL